MKEWPPESLNASKMERLIHFGSALSVSITVAICYDTVENINFKSAFWIVLTLKEIRSELDIKMHR